MKYSKNNIYGYSQLKTFSLLKNFIKSHEYRVKVSLQNFKKFKQWYLNQIDLIQWNKKWYWLYMYHWAYLTGEFTYTFSLSRYCIIFQCAQIPRIIRGSNNSVWNQKFYLVSNYLQQFTEKYYLLWSNQFHFIFKYFWVEKKWFDPLIIRRKLR